jgi:hypothetical protein
MSKHTPGPWKVSQPPDALAVLRADGIAVASLDYDGSGSGDCDEATAEANARLIAAAPALLAACEALEVRLFREQGGRENSPWAAPLALLHKVIAKATGG